MRTPSLVPKPKTTVIGLGARLVLAAVVKLSLVPRPSITYCGGRPGKTPT